MPSAQRLLLIVLDMFSRAVMALFIIAVLVSAVVTAGLRHYLPNVDQYREAVLTQINANSAGVVVQAEKIDSAWRPFRPALAFYHVTVKHRDWDKALELDSLGLELDIVKTVLSGGIRFSRIDLNELNVLLAQSDSGKWSLAGFASSSGKPLDLPVLMKQIWGIERIHLSDISVRMRPFDKPEVSLPSLKIDVTSNGDNKRIIASLSEQKSHISRLFIETQGQPLEDNFSAQAYWRVNDYQVSEFWKLLNVNSQLQSATIGGEFWLNWKDGHSQLRGKVKLDDMALQLAAAESSEQSAALETDGEAKKTQSLKTLADVLPQSLNIHHASTEFLFESKNNGQQLQLWLPFVHFRHDNKVVTLRQLSVQKQDDFSVQLGELDVQALSNFMAHLPLPEKLKAVITDLSPAGTLKNIQVDVIRQPDTPLDFALSAELHNVSANAWKGAPGISNINGVLSASKLSGQLQLYSDDGFSLTFPKLYNNTMSFEKAMGQVRWFIDATDIYVEGDELQLLGDYGHSKGEFYLQIPRDKMQGDVGRLILDVGIVDSDAKYKHHFIPKLLPKKLLGWLDASVQAGRIKQGGLIYHGPIYKPAIETNELQEHKVVQLWLDVDHARLSYLPGWPVVENAAAEVLLDEKNVIATVKRANIGGLKVSDASVAVTTTAQGQWVNVRSKVAGNTTDIMRLLQMPVLEPQLGFMKNWHSPSGNAKAEVKISTLVQDARKRLKVDVKSQLKNATLQMPEYKLQVERISGPLNFNLQKGLSSPRLTGTFWRKPVLAKVRSEGQSTSLKTVVDFSANVAAKDIAMWSGQPVFNFLQGQSRFDGDFYFGADGAGLNLASDLQGISIELPQPFAKDSDSTRDLSFHMPFSGDYRELTAKVGSGVDIRFLLEQGAFAAGQINLGLRKSEYQKNKIIIGGQVSDVDAGQWLQTFQRYQKEVSSFDDSQSFKVKTEKSVLWSAEIEKLRIRRLKAYGHSLENVKYDLVDTASFWQMAIEHPQLTGQLQIYKDDSPMRLRLRKVDLDFLQGDGETEQPVSAESAPKSEDTDVAEVEKKATLSLSPLADPALADFPAIDVSIDSLWWKKQDYGEWQFDLRASDKYLSLDNLQASVKYMKLLGMDKDRAYLRWSLGEYGRTEFNGRFVGENLADVLKAWGYSQEITSHSATFDVDVAWQGVPTDFSFDKVIGNARLEWKDGSFADVGSSQSSALKVVGFFNLSLLVKRLQLDFSDLSSKGLAYDSVEGQVFFDEGVLMLKDELYVKAPSSEIQLKGWADLNTDRVDMAMGVSLPLATNLPWVVALAAGLPAAAGVFIVSKLLKKQVSTLFSAVYKVQGDLNEPRVEFVRLFDTGLPDLSAVDKSVEEDDVEGGGKGSGKEAAKEKD